MYTKNDVILDILFLFLGKTYFSQNTCPFYLKKHAFKKHKAQNTKKKVKHVRNSQAEI